MKLDTLADQLLFSTLRIEAPPWVGTGCIVQHKWAEDKSGPFLITNKHVVKGTSSGKITFTLADQTNESREPSLGKATSITLAENGWRWSFHPSDDIDIAALPLAPVVNHLNEGGGELYYRSIGTDMIPGQDKLEELNAIEEVLFVGYPNGIYDRANQLPIFRKGTTATPLYIDYDAKPTFLIDASVFPGSSGSPVFIYTNGVWSNRAGVAFTGQRILFLGVLGSVYYHEEDGKLEFKEIQQQSNQSSRPSK